MIKSKTLKALAIFLPLTLFFSCSQPASSSSPSNSNTNDTSDTPSDTDASDTPTQSDITIPVLPANEGTAPFKGLSFIYNDEKVVFNSDNTINICIAKEKQSGNFLDYQKYKYTYNSNTKIMTLSLISSVFGKDNILKTYDDFYKEYNGYKYEDYKNQFDSEEEFNQQIKEILQNFKQIYEATYLWKAELSQGALSLQKDYYTEVPVLKGNDVHFSNYPYYQNNHALPLINIYTYDLFYTGIGHIDLYTIGHYYDGSIKDISKDIIIAEVSKSDTDKIIINLQYSIVCNNDGRLTMTIKANNDATKNLIGTGSYTLVKEGPVIYTSVTE